MKEMNVYEMWKQKVNSESDEVRKSVQIRDVSGGINVITLS